MKRITLYLLTAAMIFGIFGCDVEAGPGEITLSTGAVEPTKATVSTEDAAATEATEALPAWDEDETRAMVPAPPGRILGYEYSLNQCTAWIGETDDNKIMEYYTQLLEAGFGVYADEYITSNASILYCRNADGVIICIQCGSAMLEHPLEGTPKGSAARIAIYYNSKAYGDKGAGDKAWGVDEYQLQLPEPFPAYVDGTVFDYTYSGEYTEFYRLDLRNTMSYEDAKAYIQALRDYGYTYETWLHDQPFADQVSFVAKNEDGYMVDFSFNAFLPCIILYKPEMDGPGRAWDTVPTRSFLPEPNVSNYSQRNTSCIFDINEFVLEGMDYEGAKAYIEMLQEKGYTRTIRFEDDPEAQSILFNAGGAITGYVIAETVEYQQDDLKVTLQFDPSQVLEDGTPYSILILE